MPYNLTNRKSTLVHAIGAVRQQTISSAIDDTDLCHHVVSLGHSGLNGYDFYHVAYFDWSISFTEAYYIPRIRRIGGCYGFTSKPPATRHPPPATRNGVNAITQKPRDGLFSNLVYTLVVIVS